MNLLPKKMQGQNKSLNKEKHIKRKCCHED